MQSKSSIKRPQNRLPVDQRLQMVEQYRRSGPPGVAFRRQYHAVIDSEMAVEKVT
jgi:hypothetical protein